MQKKSRASQVLWAVPCWWKWNWRTARWRSCPSDWSVSRSPELNGHPLNVDHPQGQMVPMMWKFQKFMESPSFLHLLTMVSFGAVEEWERIFL